MSKITLVENMVDEISESYKLDSVLYGNVLVSLVEAVSNAIEHGNKLDSSKKVYVESNVTNEILSFKVTDEGVGFDHQNVPDPTSEENIDKPRGRGIFLIRRLADDVDYNELGNEIEFHFKLKLQP